MDESKFKDFLQSGAVYVCGRARPGFQPVIIFNIAKLNSFASDIETQGQCIIFLCEWAVNNLMVPGHVETWIIVMDFADVSLS